MTKTKTVAKPKQTKPAADTAVETTGAPENTATETAAPTDAAPATDAQPGWLQNRIAEASQPKKRRGKPVALDSKPAEPLPPEVEAEIAERSRRDVAAIHPNLFARGMLEQIVCDWLADMSLRSSPTTTDSYDNDLQVAIGHFPKGQMVSALTYADIEAFENCDAVMKTKTGKPKAKPTILKTRRALRLAITWAATKGVCTSPYPVRPAKLTTEAAPAA